MTIRIKVAHKADARGALEAHFLAGATAAERVDIVEAIRVAAGHLSDRKVTSYYSERLECLVLVR